MSALIVVLNIHEICSISSRSALSDRRMTPPPRPLLRIGTSGWFQFMRDRRRGARGRSRTD